MFGCKSLSFPLMVSVLFTLSCGSGEVLFSETHPSWSSDSQNISFSSRGDIYVSGIDLLDPVNITNSEDLDSEPVWAPDGSLIVYQTKGQYGPEVNLISQNGLAKTNLSSIPAEYYGLVWSPDSDMLAFSSDRVGWKSELSQGALGATEIYVSFIDGKVDIQLTFDNAIATNPTWSPDGSRVAFQSNRDGDFEIYQISIDGTGLEQLTDNTWPDLYPSWSPDGSQIAFVSSRPKTEFQADVTTGLDLYLMQEDGTSQFALTNVPYISFTNPSWSLDSKFLVFDGRYSTGIFDQRGIGMKGINEIYVMGMYDQYEYWRVTENKTNNPDLHGGPVWAPDSKTIAFHSSRSGVTQINTARIISEQYEICKIYEQEKCR